MNTDRPWMTALEMQFAALGIVRRIQAVGAPESCTDPIVQKFMAHAVPFAWSADAVSAVWQSSKSIPKDAQFDNKILPDGIPACWWWFDEPIPVPFDREVRSEEDIGALDYERIHGLLLIQNGASPVVVCDCRMSSVGPMFPSYSAITPPDATLDEFLNSGQRIDGETGLPKQGHSRRLEAVFRFVMAASVWLKQRVVVTSSGHVERHRRKQLARENDAVISDVKVVQLRRAESQPSDSCASGDPVEWSCRWIVGGHWRNQYHPSTGKHELKYILPYVKGPGDKPLKVPTQTVYAVNR